MAAGSAVGDYAMRGKLGLLWSAGLSIIEIKQVQDRIYKEYPLLERDSELYDALLGGVSASQESADIPTHDQLGRFPIARDSRGREYFDTGEPNGADPDRSRVTMYVRIPRQRTRAVQTDLSSSMNYDSLLDMPQPDEQVNLTIVPLPMQHRRRLFVEREVLNALKARPDATMWSADSLAIACRVDRLETREPAPDDRDVPRARAATGMVQLKVHDQVHWRRLVLGAMSYDYAERQVLAEIAIKIASDSQATQKERLEFLREWKAHL